MVHFENFDIEFRAKRLCGLLDQRRQQIDPEAHIAGFNNTGVAGCDIDGLLVFLRETGCPDHMHNARLCREIGVRNGGGRPTEIDDPLNLREQLDSIGVTGDRNPELAQASKFAYVSTYRGRAFRLRSPHDLAVGIFLNNLGNRTAHAPGGAHNSEFHRSINMLRENHARLIAVIAADLKHHAPIPQLLIGGTCFYMQYFQLIACSVSITLGLGLHNVANAQRPESRYIKFSLDACETIERDEESGAIIQRCNDEGDYEIYVAEGDLRYFVGYGSNGLNQRAFSQTLAPFNRINNVLELRKYEGGDKAYAAILRYYTDSGMDNGSSKGEVLVVTKLDGEEACHMAYIDARANPNANELAREIADGDEGFDCAKDEPQVIGETGVSPM